MVEALFYLITAGLAVLGLGALWAKAENAGKAKGEAEYARRREEELARIIRSGAARPSGNVRDDPFNRDNLE
ncbi:hypothetical protein G5B41_12580 [bacterium SGD-2]|nr:hypothetical protein [bacterium SGD-2]